MVHDPYAILVSEIMLQQTQAARVAAVFEQFIRRFPDVASLAQATAGDVVRAWAGLGYNRRAIALHRAARQIVARHGGRVPSDVDELRALPGVGPYTARAVAAIAFGRPVAAMDVNVRRVVARASLGLDPEEADPGLMSEVADAWLDRRNPATWNQALMDLGREVCRPAPWCGVCPLTDECRYGRAGRAGGLPVGRRQAAFEGSDRQVRGRLVAILRERPSAGVATLVRASGFPYPRVRRCLEGLVRDGLIERAGRSFRLPA